MGCLPISGTFRFSVICNQNPDTYFGGKIILHQLATLDFETVFSQARY